MVILVVSLAILAAIILSALWAMRQLQFVVDARKLVQ